MEEKKIVKKMSPLEFVNYLEGYFMVVGKRTLTDFEVANIRTMLENVDKNQFTELGQPDINYVPIKTSPSVPDPNFYHNNPGTTAPDPIFVGMPENICYCFKEKKEEE